MPMGYQIKINDLAAILRRARCRAPRWNPAMLLSFPLFSSPVALDQLQKLIAAPFDKTVQSALPTSADGDHQRHRNKLTTA